MIIPKLSYTMAKVFFKTVVFATLFFSQEIIFARKTELESEIFHWKKVKSNNDAMILPKLINMMVLIFPYMTTSNFLNACHLFASQSDFHQIFNREVALRF